jgi:hypothetical protein
VEHEEFLKFLLAYFLAIIVIIQNFRRIRIKEVEAIFAASFRNKTLFEKDMKAGD